MKPTYAEMLKHPNWQRKRLEILQRDEFTCTNCGDADSMLHVHHGYYARGLKPWEYENETLYTLCAECHERTQALLDRVQRRLGELGDSLDIILGFLDGMSSPHPSHVFTLQGVYGYTHGLGAAYGLTSDEVRDIASRNKRDGCVTDGQLTAERCRKLGDQKSAAHWDTYQP